MTAPSSEHDTFRQIFDANSDAIFVHDATGKIVMVNRQMCVMFGCTPEEALEVSIGELSVGEPPYTQAEAALHVGRALREGSHSFEWRSRRRNGEVFWSEVALSHFELSGQRRLIACVRDISARKDMEDALRRSEERFAKIFDGTSVMLAFTEPTHGKILDVNAAWMRTAGLARDAVIGKTGRELGLWTDGNQVRDAIVAALARDGRTRGHETALRMGGRLIPVEIAAELVSMRGSEYILWEIQDVSERTRAAAEERRLVAELRARNAEMEQFVYTVSHDLKSPLVTIQGFVGAIASDLTAGYHETLPQDLARITSAAAHMSTLLEDLLELARIGRVGAACAWVDTRGVIREAIEHAHGNLREGGIEIVMAEELPALWGDRPRLVQVFQNLIDNAAKYIGTPPTPRIEIFARPAATEVVVCVRDNGIGIDPSYGEQIFGLFQKLDARSRGSGVGLAQVRRIVEFHRGRVWVESDGVGHGSTFVVALPRSP